MASIQTQGIDPQAVRANKLNLVERLADDLAHEIKNPLHSMVINLEVLKRRIARSAADPDSGELMRYVGVLAGELDRVNRRVDLLLRMVRPDRGGDPVSLTGIVEELLELLELERERQAVALEYQPALQVVRGYLPRETARQIALNLLLIALDTAGPRGTLTVASVVQPDSEWLRLLAVPVETEPGDRKPPNGVEEERSRLATVRALAGAFGGRLEISGESGPETEFVFSLPVESA